jgi:ketosteroid isomerase-like protein
MLSETGARQFAHDWVRAWNSHDLDAVMSHYAPEVALTSPSAAKLLNDRPGRLQAKKLYAVISHEGLKRIQTSPSSSWM